MQTSTIAANLQPDVIGSFWIMLRRLEELARDSTSALDRRDVEGFYRQWNAMTGDDKLPIWLQQEQAPSSRGGVAQRS